LGTTYGGDGKSHHLRATLQFLVESLHSRREVQPRP
jgi:hypothetical protein